tara:strand:- start:576 stop:1043 length:468 start_codon:yes stop_codon:yes gene_type:complete
MNIFVVDEDPVVAARQLCDKHVVKMILETAQMLCTVAHEHGFNAPYKKTHPKHPCTLWAGQSADNWSWLLQHGLAMCAEYTRRYGRVHKSEEIIMWCTRMPIQFCGAQGLTPFAQAMPEQYRNECAVTAYRAYYHGEKSGFATWKSETPQWWIAA